MILPGPDNVFARISRGMMYVWIVTLVLLLYPYTEDPAAPIKQLVSAGFALAMAIVWATGVALQRAPMRRINGPCVALLVFLATQILAAALSDAPLRSFVALQPWCVFALIGLIGYQVFTHTRHLRNIFRTIVISVSLSSLYAFAQYFGIDPFPWAIRDVEEYRGLPSTYGNPNLAGHALVIAFVLCVALLVDAWMRRKRPLEPIVWAIVAAPMLGHLYLSGMRGGVAALCFAGWYVTAFMILERRGYTPVRAGLLALAATFVTLAIAVIAGLLSAPSLALDSSLQLRLNGYAGAAALYLDHWVFGIGPGNYAANNIAYWTGFESLWYALENKRNFHVHNEWLEIAVASGFLGLSAFVALYLLAIKGHLAPRATRSGKPPIGRPLPLALSAVLVAIGVDAMTGFNLHAPVSGALFFVLLLQQPCTSTSLPVLSGYQRAAPMLFIPLALICAIALGQQFQGQRHYQRAQGAMAWAHAQGVAGQHNAAQHGETVARASLRAAAEYMPWSYRAPMLAGDFELAHGNYLAASGHYENALALNPYLPRLHVQLARAQLRIAGEMTGAAQIAALERAEQQAGQARTRCPELAEAWEMLGWAALGHAGQKAENEASEQMDHAVALFTRARELGLADDINLNSALAAAYGRLGNWNAATPFFERCALAEPSTAAHWDRFAEAARTTGGPWPVRYRQALLHAIAGGVGGRTLEDLAARLAGATDSPASKGVVREVLGDAVREHPERLAIWGAWLEMIEPATRASVLEEQASPVDPSRLPDALRAMLEVAADANTTTLDRAAETLFQALATAPGGERTGHAASACQPLTDLLGDVGLTAGLWEAAHATTWTHLGAAYLEAGELEKADALLREAEQRLPAARRPLAWYYRSRVLLGLGQPDAALTVAQQASRADNAPIEYHWQLARCMAAAGEGEAAAYLYQSLQSRIPPDHPYQRPMSIALEELRADAEEGQP